MVESRHQWKAWIYLAPAIVLLLIFTVYPIFNTIRISFLEGYNPLEAMNGTKYAINLQNFAKVLKYKNFFKCLKNTLQNRCLI